MTRDELKAQVFSVAKEMRLPLHLPDLPVLPAGFDALKDRRIVFVDDGLDVLAAFFIPLMLATDGMARFVYQIRQTPEEVVAEILAKDPEIVLIDQYLGKYHGHQLVEPLMAAKPSLICIGFSNAPSAEEAFTSVGAKFVLKEASEPWLSLSHVVELLM